MCLTSYICNDPTHSHKQIMLFFPQALLRNTCFSKKYLSCAVYVSYYVCLNMMIIIIIKYTQMHLLFSYYDCK